MIINHIRIYCIFRSLFPRWNRLYADDPCGGVTLQAVGCCWKVSSLSIHHEHCVNVNTRMMGCVRPEDELSPAEMVGSFSRYK